MHCLEARLPFSILRFLLLDFLFLVFCSSHSVWRSVFCICLFFFFVFSSNLFLHYRVFSSYFLFFILNFLLPFLFQLYYISHPFFVFLFSVFVSSWRDSSRTQVSLQFPLTHFLWFVMSDMMERCCGGVNNSLFVLCFSFAVVWSRIFFLRNKLTFFFSFFFLPQHRRIYMYTFLFFGFPWHKQFDFLY